MTNAIEAGDGAVALRQLALMFDAGAPPEKILGQLGWLVRTKFPMICRPAARRRRCAVPDGPRPEGSAGDPRILLERLVVELCAGKRAGYREGRDRLGRFGARREPRREPRLVAAGGVAVDDALARHPVDERDRLLQGRLAPARSLPSIAVRMLLSALRSRERS